MRRNLRNYFIPHEGNDHQPHSLREKSVIYFLAIVLFVEIGFLTALFSPLATDFKDNLAAVLPRVLIASTNDERLDRNLGMLNTNPLLVQAAQLKADDMSDREFFAHINPDGDQPWVYIDEVGYDYEAAGENLAVNFIDSDDVHKAWMKSPTHKANIVQGKFTEIGIATSRGKYKGKDVIFVAQFFASPKIEVKQIAKVDSETVDINTESNEVAVEDGESKVLGVETVSNNARENNNLVEAELDSLLKVEETTENSEKSIEESFNFIEEKIGKSGTEEDEDLYPLYVEEPDKFDKLFSHPRGIITSIITIIFTLVALALILKVFIKINIQHKKMVIYGTLLLIIILSILVFNEQIVRYLGEI